MKYLYKISHPGYTIGIEVDHEGLITRVPPIARWMINKPISVVEQWAKHKKYEFEQIDDSRTGLIKSPAKSAKL